VLLTPQGPEPAVFAGYGEDGKPDEGGQPVRKYGHHRSTGGGVRGRAGQGVFPESVAQSGAADRAHGQSRSVRRADGWPGAGQAFG
jgi:hypothetical protein